MNSEMKMTMIGTHITNDVNLTNDVRNTLIEYFEKDSFGRFSLFFVYIFTTGIFINILRIQ